jgi:hypothetical protein
LNVCLFQGDHLLFKLCCLIGFSSVSIRFCKFSDILGNMLKLLPFHYITECVEKLNVESVQIVRVLQ